MYNQDALSQAVEFLRKEIDPSFVYLMEENDTEKILHIVAMYDSNLDVYGVSKIEIELSHIMEDIVQLYNTHECDVDFISEVLQYGDLVYCKDDLMRKRFLGGIAQDCVMENMKRSLLINRMNECGSLYEM